MNSRSLSVGAAVAIGVALFVAIQGGAHKQEPTEQAEHVIEITDEGFSPQEITIRKGERVEWKNVGSDWYWPASNLHPTHELYAAFDPREPIAPGTSWVFQFDQTGTWPFHDHLRPELLGTVIVKASDQE